MIIKEAYMKNFGKFQKKRISFQQGINIVYGENESGKTTLYTFLQGVFFGIPRKRGTASKTAKKVFSNSEYIFSNSISLEMIIG